MTEREICAELERCGQGHLLARLGDWNEAEREEFFARAATVDFSKLDPSRPPRKTGRIAPIEPLTLPQIARDAARYRTVGEEVIRAGGLACVLLAGGQGTRLGSDGPKGMFDIGVSRPLYIFEILIGNLLGVCRRAGGYPLLFVMTSEKNDLATRTFLQEHRFFGYPEGRVRFFVQEASPCTDFEGRVLLEGRGKLALSPNGNGGWYSALLRAGFESDLAGVEWFNVFSVDNVLQRIADPVFLGATVLSGKSCGAKGLKKSCPEEKVGVLCLEDGLPTVIEYFELDGELARLRDGAGELVYGFGVTLNYLFRADRLKEAVSKGLPLHVVRKKIPFLGEDGKLVLPAEENGCKYETLIVDLVRNMGDCLPFEIVREREFAPVKNRTGTDSVETARELLRYNGVEL